MYAEYFHLGHLPHVAIIHPKHRSIIWGLDGWTSEKQGDELFQAMIGNPCGSKPSTHWIYIYGVQDRKINQSWHLDFGKRTKILEPSCGVFHPKTTMRDVASFRTSFPRNKSVWRPRIFR
jgi:hypothetical protein